MATGLEGLVMLLKWFRKDCGNSEPMDTDFLFRWGYITEGGKPRKYYILLKLPSYSHKLSVSSDEYRWHQAVLVFTEPLIGKWSEYDGWRISDIELSAQPA